jgi:putative ABC transport system permease protein
MNASQSTPHSSQQVASRREKSPHTSMFVRMMIRAAILRRGRALSALLAMVVAAAVTTAMLNLYVDTQAKLRGEFRNYGANVVIVAKDSQPLPAGSLAKIESTLGPNALAVPFSYAVARTKDGQAVVIVGTDFTRARRLNRWWNVDHWPTFTTFVTALPDPPSANPPAPTGPKNAAQGASPGSDTSAAQAPQGRQTTTVDALIGIRALGVVSPDRQPFYLTFHNHTLNLKPSGILQTGSSEDSRIYLDQSAFQNWTGIAPTTIEISINGSTAEINSVISLLTQALPTADVRPFRQILEGEANVLNKTRATLYAASTLIVLTAALCVLATLIGWVFDRRRDFAIMKALGASQRLLNGFFAAEAATLGAIGAVIGFVLGIGIAAWIGRVNFHSPVAPRFSVFPYVFTGSILVALIASIAPLTLLRRVQPALILRGE